MQLTKTAKGHYMDQQELDALKASKYRFKSLFFVCVCHT